MKENKEEKAKEKGWIVLLPKVKKEIKLDKKDQIILQALVENARTSISTLAKITRLSKNSIINRIKNYEKEGLIDKFSTFISIHRLRIKMYQIGIKTKMTLAQKEKFIEHLKKIKFLNQIIVLSSSHWDFFIRLYVKNLEQLNKIITQINSFSGIIHMDIIPTESWDFAPVKYFDINVDLDKYTKKEDSSFQKTFRNRKKNKSNKISFDKVDLKILNILAHDARIPLIEIAPKIHLSPDAVKYRIKNLINKGVIEIFFVNLNPFMLGYSAYLFAFQIFNRERIKEIINYLSHHPRCTGVMITESNWNLIGAILFKDTKELKEFEEQFFSKFEQYVHDYEFIQILEQPYYRLFLDELLDLE